MALACFLSLATLVSEARAQTYDDGLNAMQSGDPKTAFSIWKALADQGDPPSQYSLALLLETGSQETPRDIPEAVRYYQLAAAADIPEAQTNLGLLYTEGRGVPRSAERAVALWKQSSRAGHPMGLFNLGLAYYQGSGVDPDQDEALGLIFEAALKNLKEAQFALGQFYRLGLGVKNDPSEALYWYRLSANQGHAEAQSFANQLAGQGVQAKGAPNPAVRPNMPRLLTARNAKTQQPLPVRSETTVAAASPQPVRRASASRTQVAPQQLANNQAAQPVTPAPAPAPAPKVAQAPKPKTTTSNTAAMINAAVNASKTMVPKETAPKETAPKAVAPQTNSAQTGPSSKPLVEPKAAPQVAVKPTNVEVKKPVPAPVPVPVPATVPASASAMPEMKKPQAEKPTAAMVEPAPKKAPKKPVHAQIRKQAAHDTVAETMPAENDAPAPQDKIVETVTTTQMPVRPATPQPPAPKPADAMSGEMAKVEPNGAKALLEQSVKIDKDKAVIAYLTPTEAENSYQEGLALLQVRDGGRLENGGLAIVKIFQSAISSHAKAQRALGELYLLGLDIERSEEQALYWLREAEHNGIADRSGFADVLELRGLRIPANHHAAPNLLN